MAVRDRTPLFSCATLRQAQGDLASAEAAVLLKRQNLERKKVLAPQRAASQFDLDQATAELTQATATVVVKQAARDLTQSRRGPDRGCRALRPRRDDSRDTLATIPDHYPAALMQHDNTTSLVDLRDIVKIYQSGEAEVKAVRGVQLAIG
jgi:hypothetical protein